MSRRRTLIALISLLGLLSLILAHWTMANKSNAYNRWLDQRAYNDFGQSSLRSKHDPP